MASERRPHVVREVRTIYRSARGWRLQKRAAYIGAAKALIAAACNADSDARLAADPEQWEGCSREGDYQCRFHRYTEPDLDYDGSPVGDYGMLYYVKVRKRLASFLEFVDRRAAEKEQG